MKVRALLSFGWFVDAQIIVSDCDDVCKQKVAEALDAASADLPLSCMIDEADDPRTIVIRCPGEINTDNTDDVFYRWFIMLYSDAIRKLKARVERAAGPG